MSKRKLKLNLNNFNLRSRCFWYPCHQHIPDDEFDCRLCYCPFYEKCSQLELTKLGGYWKHYKEKYGNVKKVWACENCTIVHHKSMYKKIQQWRSEGLTDKEILLELVRHKQEGRV